LQFSLQEASLETFGYTLVYSLMRHSNVLLDVQSFRGDNCDTDHYLLVAKLRERISVSKTIKAKV
jgi:hypothetical protein